MCTVLNESVYSISLGLNVFKCCLEIDIVEGKQSSNMCKYASADG